MPKLRKAATPENPAIRKKAYSSIRMQEMARTKTLFRDQPDTVVDDPVERPSACQRCGRPLEQSRRVHQDLDGLKPEATLKWVRAMIMTYELNPFLDEVKRRHLIRELWSWELDLLRQIEERRRILLAVCFGKHKPNWLP